VGELGAEPSILLLLKHALPSTSLLPSLEFGRWTPIGFGAWQHPMWPKSYKCRQGKPVSPGNGVAREKGSSWSGERQPGAWEHHSEATCVVWPITIRITIS